MAIDAATVRKVAKLARISEAEERLAPLARHNFFVVPKVVE